MLWVNAIVDFEDRLTPTIIDTNQTINPTHLDFASWAGIAGDLR